MEVLPTAGYPTTQNFMIMSCSIPIEIVMILLSRLLRGARVTGDKSNKIKVEKGKDDCADSDGWQCVFFRLL